jgi:hypothetical protein
MEATHKDWDNLLLFVSNKAQINELSTYVAQTQDGCITHCHSKVFKDDLSKPNEAKIKLPKESLLALEDQCQKLCVRKFYKAYTYQNDLLRGERKL